MIQPHCEQLDRVKVSMLLCRSGIGDDSYIQITNSTKETFHTEQSKNVINQLATLKLYLLYLLLKSRFDGVDDLNSLEGTSFCLLSFFTVCRDGWVGLGGVRGM